MRQPRAIVALSAFLGDAPNFTIKAIAEERSLGLPAFLAYLAYASALLLPLLAL